MRQGMGIYMQDYTHILEWIDEQHTNMLDHVIEWSNINSYTFNFLGLKTLSQRIAEAFGVFEEEVMEVPILPFKYVNLHGEKQEVNLIPPLLVCKRPCAPRQVMMAIHMDTTYPPHESLQEAFLIEGRFLSGQGVTDAKGGMAVLLKTLEAFELSDVAQNIGWKVVITTDDEIGSPCSAKVLESVARQCDIGLVFEPCLPDGSLVGSRKGAGYFTLVAQGRSAYAGDNFSVGRHAIEALASCITKLQEINGKRPGLSINVGLVHGDSSDQLVADVAIMRFDVRISHFEDRIFAEEMIKKIIQDVSLEKHIDLFLYGGFSLPPKPLKGKTLELYRYFQQCGAELGLCLQWKDSGCVCAGNRLNAVGLPTIDTLGVQGNKLYSKREEFMYIESLKERTKLTTLALLKWASGEWFI